MHMALLGKRVCEWTLFLGVLLMPLAILGQGYRVAAAPKFFVFMGVVLGVGVALCLAWQTVNWNRAPMAWPWFVLLGVTGLQTLRSINMDAAVEVLLLQVGGGIVGLGAALLVDRWIWILRGIALASVGVSIVGVLEYLGLSFIVLPSAGRPSATMGFRNIAAMYLAVSLFLSGCLLFEKNKKDRWLGAVAGVLMGVFLIFTRTRGAWLGVSLASLSGLFIAWRFVGSTEIRRWLKRAWIGVAIGGGLILLGVFIPANFQDKSVSRIDEKKASVAQTIQFVAQEGGDRGRLQIWKHTLYMIADAPLFGVGHHNWSVYYPRYDQGDVMGIVVAPRRPHNDFLWIWAEIGLVGFLAYCWLLWCVFCQMRRHVLVHNWIPVCAGLGVLALLVHSCFSFPREQPLAVFFLSLALGMAGRGDKQEFSHAHWRTIGLGGLGVCVGLVGLIWGHAILKFDGHFSRALHAQSLNNFEGAVEASQKARTHGLFDHRVLLLEGVGRHALDDFAGAVQVYKTYLGYQPYLPAVHNNLGRAYEELKDTQAAEKAYVAGLETFRGDGAGILITNLAAVYKRQGKIDEALALYEEADDLPAEGYHNLGLIYAERSLWDDALTAYQKALIRAPDMAVVYFSMAGVDLLQGQIERAAQNYETFLDRWDGVQDYVRDAHKRLRQIYPALGDQYLRAGKFKDAGRVYTRLVDLGDDSPSILNNLVLIYGRLGHYEKAINFGNYARQRHPQFVQIHLSLATVYEDQRDRKNAVRHYQLFLKNSSQDDPLAKRAQSRLNALMATP